MPLTSEAWQAVIHKQTGEHHERQTETTRDKPLDGR
jgi:hypothetical protein